MGLFKHHHHKHHHHHFSLFKAIKKVVKKMNKSPLPGVKQKKGKVFNIKKMTAKSAQKQILVIPKAAPSIITGSIKGIIDPSSSIQKFNKGLKNIDKHSKTIQSIVDTTTQVGEVYAESRGKTKLAEKMRKTRENTKKALAKNKDISNKIDNITDKAQKINAINESIKNKKDISQAVNKVADLVEDPVLKKQIKTTSKVIDVSIKHHENLKDLYKNPKNINKHIKTGVGIGLDVNKIIKDVKKDEDNYKIYIKEIKKSNKVIDKVKPIAEKVVDEVRPTADKIMKKTKKVMKKVKKTKPVKTKKVKKTKPVKTKRKYVRKKKKPVAKGGIDNDNIVINITGSNNNLSFDNQMRKNIKNLEKYTKIYQGRNQLLINIIEKVKFEKPKLPKRRKKTHKVL
jgi:histone H1/5